MGTSAAAIGIGPLLLNSLFQLAGVAGGAVVRESAQLWVGPDPRRARFWLSEAVIIAVLSGALGYAFAHASDVTAVGPPFGAALTTYAVLSGAHAFVSARTLNLTRPVLHGAAHAVGCIVVGTLVFAAVQFATVIGAR